MIVSSETASALVGGILSAAEIAAYLPAAQEMCESYCNRKFEYATFTQAFDGGRKIYPLRAYPVEDITSVTVDDIATTDYTVDYDTGEVCLDIRAPDGRRNVVIVYAGGYAADEMPYTMQLAVASLAVALPSLMEGGGQLSTGNGERIGTYQAGYTRNSASDNREGLKFISPVTAALLRDYKGRWL